MSDQHSQPESDEALGRLDDRAEAEEQPSTEGAAAARGDYDPAEGSPGGEHPVGEGFPDEQTKFDDPQQP